MSLERTPLYDRHVALGAKMVPFSGWEMPVQYQGILAEHAHTRQKTSIFDICHMGEFFVEGPGAGEALDALVTQDVLGLAPGQCRYGFLLNEQGGVIDDLIVYRLEQDRYMIVVNASRIENDKAQITAHLPAGLRFEDQSAATAKIDVQGPTSLQVMEETFKLNLKDMGYFRCREESLNGVPALVSRTGYTGELGYEIYVAASDAGAVWDALMTHPDVAPVGLGARDTLRLEMGYPLYGQDLDDKHTPAEAGYAGMITKDRPFIGRENAFTVRESLIALSAPGRKSPRHDDAVRTADGRTVGKVTSGSFAPSLGHCVALAYVAADAASASDFVIVPARGEIPATRVDLPFYKAGTARKKVSA